jgi:DNA-binding MarR family transcriptional regulator
MRAKVSALIEQIESGQLKTNNAKILDKFVLNPEGLTVYDLRIHLGMAHQTLTSRISDLEDMGVIFAYKTVERTVDGKARKYTLYKYSKDSVRQMQNALLRRETKFNSIIKRLENEYQDLFTNYIQENY